MIRTRSALASAFLAAAPAFTVCASDPYLLTIQPGASMSTSNSIFAPSSGTLIGNYDATSNPAGTRTLPGLFGGSGNNAIPLSLDVEVGGDNETSPAGSMTIVTNVGAGTFAIASLGLDLLNETVIELPITATIQYSTFRTVSPSFLYLGGVPLAIPFGSARVTVLDATLGAGVSGGAMTPNGDGSYTLNGVAALDVAFQAVLLDQPVDGGTVPVIAPIGGTFTPSIDGSTATLSISIGISNASEVPGPFPAVENVPFDLPTLDSNAPAHVLLTLNFERIDLTLEGAVAGIAAGSRLCRADFNLDSVADILDFLDFLAGFGDCQGLPSPCPDQILDADVNSDGLVDILDFLDFLQAFSDGCE